MSAVEGHHDAALVISRSGFNGINVSACALRVGRGDVVAWSRVYLVRVTTFTLVSVMY